MMTAFFVYKLRYLLFASETHRTLWQDLRRYFYLLNDACISVLSHLLGYQIALPNCSFHRTEQQISFVLCASCLPYCLFVFPKINDLGLRICGYRNDDRQINQKGLLWLICMIRDGLFPSYHKDRFPRSPISRRSPSTPSILFRCKRLWISLCLLSPKIYQYIYAVYFSYQHLLSRCWSLPWTVARRRGLSMGVIISYG